jgi:hypothetical protein
MRGWLARKSVARVGAVARVIALAWHRDRYRPPAAEIFADVASEVCRELEREAGLAPAAKG